MKKRMLNLLDKVPFRTLLWLFPVVVTIHNIEEAVWMPAWAQSAMPMPVRIEDKAFWFGLAVATLLVYAITYYGSKSRNESGSAYLLTGVIAIVFLNVFFPHVLATILLREYAPGVVTGVLLTFPVTLYLLYRARRERFIDPGKLKRATAFAAVAAVAVIALSFYVGSMVL
ncbi:HXXEE domain-containing protein [Paenibacillus thermotolerans]|uniref:HXXEE domain-containing protein n=1 Tax=Paenibacillus thermotolerans TaxID=3027807 RepID=UPI0023684EB1|nr:MULTISPECIES: HXXEE domain-containing protein [unclassified Paenibacillus]